MAAERRNRYYSENRRYADHRYYGSRAYVDGSTVRKEEEYEYQHRENRRKKQVSDKVRRNREKARHMNTPYVIMLIAATIVTVVICYQYLQIQSSIAMHKKNITDLQASISALQLANDAAEDSIEIYTDLDYIYSVATSEFGMIYPSDEQVIEYDKSESEFVRQYDEIPTAE